MVKHTQTIHRQQPTNCLSVFNQFVGLVLKWLIMTIFFFFCSDEEEEESPIGGMAAMAEAFFGKLPTCVNRDFIDEVSATFLCQNLSKISCSIALKLIQKQSRKVFCEEKRSQKFHKIHRKTPVPESLF